MHIDALLHYCCITQGPAGLRKCGALLNQTDAYGGIREPITQHRILHDEGKPIPSSFLLVACEATQWLVRIPVTFLMA